LYYADPGKVLFEYQRLIKDLSKLVMGNNYNSLRAFEDFAIDLERKVLWINDTPVDLPFKAVEMLCVLVERDGEVVTREELLDELWADSFVEESVLTQNVYVLRKVFRKYGFSKNLIETIPRRGYRFAGQVRDVDDGFEVTIERQTIERRIIAEAEWTEEDQTVGLAHVSDDRPQPRTKRTSYSRKALYAAAGLALLAVASLAASLWTFRQEDRQRVLAPADDSQGDLVFERLSDSGRAYYVALSRDDQIAAYVIHTSEDKYSLTLHNLATGSKTEAVRPQKAHLHNVIFSPDGNYIYYAARIDDKPMTAYRIPIYGGQSEEIVSNFVHRFSLSPDGEWLAFYRLGSGLPTNLTICRSRDGSECRVVTTYIFNVWGKAPEWSADGRKLVAATTIPGNKNSKRRQELIEIDVESGDHKLIKSPDWYHIGQPYWEADGKGLFVLVSAKRGEPFQIWHLEYPSGKARQITKNRYNYREFRLSSDSTFLVASTWESESNLFLVNAEGDQTARQLTFDAGVLNGEFGIKWTTDGKKLVYAQTRAGSIGNLWVIDAATKERRQITYDEGSVQHYIDVTPDGKSAVFGSDRGGEWEVWQVDLDGENLKQVTRTGNARAPEVSPDGNWLYYIGDGLWKVPMQGGEPAKIMEQTPGTTRVSPADPHRLISYYRDPNEKAKDPWIFIDYTEQNPKAFTDLGLDAIILFEWKPDGSGIYFGDVGESFNNLWFLSLKDMKKTKVTSFGDQKISNFSLSPDGKTFALARGQVTGRVFRISGFGGDK
jgi:Tol biopolymer transport system component/DNA-binding winged helix-turn-helix (wHTH) protein